MTAQVAPTYREHELFSTQGVLAGIWTMSGDSQLHGHDFLELAVIGGGRGRHVSSHGTVDLRVGDVFVLRPGAWHGFVDCDDLLVANCCLSARSLRGELAFLYDDPALRELLWLGPIAYKGQGVSAVRVEEDAARRVVAEVAAWQDRAPVNRTLLLGRLLTVLGHLVGSSPTPEPAHPAVAATIACLEQAPERAWTMPDLAARSALDPAYLTRLFRRHVGLSPMAYLARIRAEHAAVLLARTDEAISRVGALVGWPDPTWFARRFRTLVGLTPTEYRRRARSSSVARDR
ncbi:MAG TPA: AraC family transcriptional regulator [Actinopolymorphaceae bacterium]